MADTLYAQAKENVKVKTLAQRIEAKQKQMEMAEDRITFDERVRDVIRYARPDLSEYLDETQRKYAKRQGYMYTSKPLTDLEKTADLFCGNVFTPQGWLGFEFVDPRLRGLDAGQKYLQNLREHLYGVYDATNFYHATAPSVAMDALSIGEGLAYIGTDSLTKAPFFEYAEILQAWLERDRRGNLVTVHTKWRLPAHEAMRRWGDANSDEVKASSLNDPGKYYTFIQAIYQYQRTVTLGGYDAVEVNPMLEDVTFYRPRPFVECWVECGSRRNTMSDENGLLSGIVYQSGYYTMPFASWPYWLKSGRTYGMGPYMSAISSIKRLHAEHKQMMQAGQRSAAPSLWATESLKGKVDLSADGITYVPDAERDKIGKLGNDPHYPFGIDQLDRSEDELAQTLHMDVFLALTLKNKEMNNPEVYEVIGEKAAGVAPRIGNLQRIFLDACHARLLQIEQMNRRLPEMPAELEDMLGTGQYNMGLKVQYKGPLSLAYDQMLSQRRMAQTFGPMAPFLDIDREMVRAKIKTSLAIEHILDNGDFPQDSIRSEEEVAEYIARQNTALVAQQNAETVKTQSEAVKNLAKAQQ